jgi:propionate CoA-transferase
MVVEEGSLRIVREGRARKFVQAVEHVTFSGEYAAEIGQPVLYVTERCVLRRTRRGMELIEVAPGIDIERDILAQMDFQPIVDNPKLMDVRIFEAPPMGLEQVLLGLAMIERFAYDEARNTLFINFEGFHIRTTDDVELVRREVERTCRTIGRKVHLVANYDGCQIDAPVADAYFSMITYMQNRYYKTASRYTTSAFMRLKLGEALKDRDVSPHVFETKREAQAASEEAVRTPPLSSRKQSRVRKKAASAA